MDVLRNINLFKSYKVRPYLLNAEDYGVPQQREKHSLGTRSDVDLVFPLSVPYRSLEISLLRVGRVVRLPNEGWLASRGQD